MTADQETSQLPSFLSISGLPGNCSRVGIPSPASDMTKWENSKSRNMMFRNSGGGKELMRCNIKSTPVSMGRWIKHILNAVYQAHYFRRAIGQARELTVLLHHAWQKENQFLYFISALPYRITLSSSVICYYVLLLKWAISQLSEALGSSSNTNLTRELASLWLVFAEYSALQLTFRKQPPLEACLTPGLWLRI